MHGRVYAINFWASWCAPCRREAPELAKVAGSGVYLVGVDVDDTVAAARRFLVRYGLTVPQFADRTGRTLRSAGGYGLPTTFLVDRKGTVAARLVGPQTATIVLERVRRLEGKR